ncbi:MAG: VanZ family protein [Halobacteria archaeon]
METRKRWFVFAACAAAVVVASFVPTSTAPSTAAEAHAASDGLWHAATYAVLAGTGFYAAERERWLVVALGVFFLGAGVEAGQAFVSYRTASVADTAANGVGVAVALTIAEARRLTV